MKSNYEMTFNEFKTTEVNNSNAIKEVFKNEIKIFEELFDIQLKLFQNHSFGFIDPYYSMQKYEKIVIQSFFKNNYLLYTAENLIIKGNYGAANILLRQIFEFLILGKYASIVKNEKMAEHWLNEGQFDVYDKIIKLLQKPNKKSFHFFG